MKLLLVVIILLSCGCSTTYISYVGHCVKANYSFWNVTIREKMLCYERPFHIAESGFIRMDNMDDIVEPPPEELFRRITPGNVEFEIEGYEETK